MTYSSRDCADQHDPDGWDDSDDVEHTDMNIAIGPLFLFVTVVLIALITNRS
ncbi:hypothetical protein SALBM135S_02693 [Streptomyces alboniger]